MAALIATQARSVDKWSTKFRAAAPERTFHIFGEDAFDPADIRYVIAWNPPGEAFAGLPNLEVVFNLGAGVDGILKSPSLPDVPVVRLVEDDMTERMAEWVTLQVLLHHRQTLQYLEQQRRGEWRERPQPIASDVRVGMMGYGVLAQHAAKILSSLGFSIHAWSRSDKAADVPLYAGKDNLAAFLGVTDILVALIPLTAETTGILDAELIAGLAQDGALGGPILVNAGRGGLQTEADILAALKDGTLKGASLDVFNTEPLPKDDPIWSAPNLVITPHVAAISEVNATAAYVLGQIEAFERGEALRNVVERGRGY
ncbi:glyoxylate/hydroxypyruvate reductase A [Acuticoccus sp. M5D2P5]|uniref:2-hydroxyacid dehydrogenase n=1 Tax=Acuticoccus kalidii TaxID=2910977 RepID=UPI001F19F110|nr:glyoxylate/hydroxypyruvate reductase A [Acuticoccus kalidii]MCF3936502.1 glyoxylate/hydroxypyruvate reductase A [Acuticoccus kalidii]